MNWYKIFNSLAEAENKIPLYKAISVYIKAEDKHICLARTQTGFYAVDDQCPHMGVSLSKGVCNRFGEITCPWHSYRFNLQSGEETTGNDCKGLTVYSVIIQQDGLSIGIERTNNNNEN